jgi:predicted RNA-binding Zn ribbon-like protein
VVFTHDTELALRAAVALATSATEPDTLTSIAELDAYVKQFQYTGRHERTRAELEAVRALRPRLRELLTAERDQAADLVNVLLREHGAIPQLVRHPSQDWHVHATSPEDPLAVRIAVEAAMAMVDVIRADEMSRLGVCADADCEGIVLDLSRNRSRRYCSTLCSNRNAVAAYRARSAQTPA